MHKSMCMTFFICGILFFAASTSNALQLERGASIYTLTNYTAKAAVKTAAFSITISHIIPISQQISFRLNRSDMLKKALRGRLKPRVLFCVL